MPSPLVLLACTPADDRPARAELDAAVAWSERVPTVATVSWTGEGPGWVEYGLDGALDLRTPVHAGPDPEVVLLGLKAGRRYAWRAVQDGRRRLVRGPVGTLDVPEAPDGLARLVVEADPASAVAPGFVLVSVGRFGGPFEPESWVVIYDGEGDPVWWVRNPEGHVTVTPSLAAVPGALLWDAYDFRTTALGAVGFRVTLDGREVDQVPLPDGHHAVVAPEPGVLAWIARDLRGNPGGIGFVTADQLYEAPLHATEAPRDVIALYDTVSPSFAHPCGHTREAQAVGLLAPVFEWAHTNSLVYLPERDAYLLHARWLDAVYLVDRASGAVVWQLGGPGGEFVLPDGRDPYGSAWDSVLGHAHLSQAWDGGLVAFDNGSHREPARSAIVELAWDEEARTVEEVFRWEHPEGRFVGILGDARRLPGGSYLASWGPYGEITEVAPDGRVLWSGRAEPLMGVSRLVFLEDLYAL